MSHEPSAFTEAEYVEAEQAYMATLTIEHFAQTVGQSRQRERTVGSFAVLCTRRPEVRYFNELLVQYPRDGKIQQVVPDNMVVCSAEPIKVHGSFNIPFQPALPFFVLDYISSLSKRQDYVENFRIYERDSRVPYYLVFHAEQRTLVLYRHDGRAFVPVAPNYEGRFAIPELDLETALFDEWARFWCKGERLLLSVEMQAMIDEMAEEMRLRNEIREYQKWNRLAEAKIVDLRAQIRALGIEPTH